MRYVAGCRRFSAMFFWRLCLIACEKAPRRTAQTLAKRGPIDGAVDPAAIACLFRVMVRPRRFFNTPDIAPRIVWDCKPVASAISMMVAPSGDFSIAIRVARFVPTRIFGLDLTRSDCGAFASISTAKSPASMMTSVVP